MVAADHPGEADLSLGNRFALHVGAVLLVGPLGQVAGETVDVGRGGEGLGHQARASALERRGGGEGEDGRAHHAGIDQLARLQALGVAVTGGGGVAVHDGDQVGRGGADIDEERVRHMAASQGRRGVPVRRGHVDGGARRLTGREEPGPATINPHRTGEIRARPGGELRHAIGAVGEAVGEFARHGDDVFGLAARAQSGSCENVSSRAGRPRQRRQGACTTASTRPPRTRAALTWTPPRSQPITGLCVDAADVTGKSVQGGTR